MNKQTVCDILLGVGFTRTKNDGGIITAVRYDTENPDQGIRMTCFFAERSGQKGRLLLSVDLYVFPIFGKGGTQLNGVVKRNFDAGKEIASYFDCPVHAITCKPIAKFNQTGE